MSSIGHVVKPFGKEGARHAPSDMYFHKHLHHCVRSIGGKLIGHKISITVVQNFCFSAWHQSWIFCLTIHSPLFSSSRVNVG